MDLTFKAVKHACEVMGFSEVARADRDAVEVRFRELVRAAHPDVGGDAADAPRRIVELKEARKIIIAYLEDAPSPSCFMCKGKGVVIIGPFGATEPCPRCGR